LTEASRYPANVFWSAEDEGYIAIAPDLPGCSAFGTTQQEALTELQDAIAAWIEAARAAGNAVPPPSRPAEEANCSGKVLVRMPKSLHAGLAKQAKQEEVSLNQHIASLLTSATTQQACQPSVFQQGETLHWVRQLMSDKILVVLNYISQDAYGVSNRPYFLTCGTGRHVGSDHI
jgi:predicted RNase H-like HicB family nuclease